MAKNEFKPFATGSGANVTTQTDWESLLVLSAGFTSGKASSAQVNKGLRQGTAMAAAVGQFIADKTNEDVKDDGDIAGLSAQLASAIEQAATGRLIGVRTITTSGTYTPTPGTKSIIVEVQGAGGGGGGVGTTNSTSVAVGCGGGGGAYAKSRITNLDSAYTVTIGAGGAGGVNGNGGNGGGSSFGSITAGGGFGGGSGNGVPPIIQNSTGIPTASGGNLINQSGSSPIVALALSTVAVLAGGGGSSPCGVGGGPHGSAGKGFQATGYGAGGGGANAYVNNSAQYNGAAGSNGVVIVWEYA
ncbi:hypothetical protein D7V53_20510 [Escherichia coli]|uniref:glycine-rich domain-containing protein n=1 Tax=Enterobacteriaceae TaxID=543 RepID=UPI000BAECB4D|nr:MULTISPECIES: hypothetical protein [Enterobacteriaceae]EEW5978146.1 hypothetical protein [Escherichia coli]EFC3018876.1 hypothetical protein [Escherichia coli]EHU6073239.1 hypothetical protein [Escherichia coli]EID7294201.1 hypothetical protein [Escherichia coli]EIF9754801.1 hypothetical protein [Escherichia coli]